MKYSDRFEWYQRAGRLEAVLLVVSAIGLITSVFVLLREGWKAGVIFGMLSVVVFALSQVVEMLSDLARRIHGLEDAKANSEKTTDPVDHNPVP
jgi:hypothetical protein